MFKKVDSGPRAGNVEIVNVHPATGRTANYLLGPSNVSAGGRLCGSGLVKGINPEHSELIFAGTTTIGTQAAVEFVTQRKLFGRAIEENLNVKQPSELKSFEAVIQVKVAKGVPVESSLVALRVLN